MGAEGSIGHDANMAFCREKALTGRPVDLLGAGDAVLAVTAPFALAGFVEQVSPTHWPGTHAAAVCNSVDCVSPPA